MDFNFMRRKSIFDTPPPSTGNYGPLDFNTAASAQNQNVTDPMQMPQTPPPTSKFSSTYSDLADEKGGPAFQKYNDYLNTAEPKRDDFKPTKLNRLSAILAGVSDGIQHGGGAGYKTATNILDEPYNEAREDYTLQGKKLGEAAGIEEKDMGRRVGILKDIIAQEHNDRTATETEKYHQGLLENGRERNKRTGLHYSDITNPITGNRSTSIISPDGKIGDINLGRAALTGQERIDEAGKKAGAEASATEGSKIKIAKAGIDERGKQSRDTLDHKFENLQEFLQAKQDNGWGSKYVGHRNKEGKLVMINNQDPTDIHVTGTDFDTMSDADKQKAKIELKKAPNAPKEDTTKKTNVIVDGNKRTVETTTTHGAAKVHVKLSDGRELDIPSDKLEEAKKRDPKLVVK